MDQYAKKLRRGLLEMGFQFGLDVMDPRERQIVGEGAVAGNVKASSNPCDNEIVNIENFWKLIGSRLELPLQVRIANQFIRLFNGRGFAFDMSEDFSDLRHVTTHVSFEISDLIVGTLEGHALIEFNMLLDVELAG